jgi:hypothetical protein
MVIALNRLLAASLIAMARRVDPPIADGNRAAALARLSVGAGWGVAFPVSLGRSVCRGDREELLEVLARDQAAPADLEIGQVPAAHLVVEQVAGQAGESGGLIDGVGQPLGRRLYSRAFSLG